MVKGAGFFDEIESVMQIVQEVPESGRIFQLELFMGEIVEKQGVVW